MSKKQKPTWKWKGSKKAGRSGAKGGKGGKGGKHAKALEHQRAALAHAAAVGLLVEWVEDPSQPPPKVIAKMIDHLREALKKALVCAQGKAALDEIEAVLDKYGKILPADTKAKLIEAGEQLWEDLVRLGCPT